MSSRAAKRRRRTQCKQVNSQTNVEDKGDSSNKQHDLSSTTIQKNKNSKSTKKSQQLSDNESAENLQQKEDIELDNSNDETEKRWSQGGSDHSSDDLDLATEMMMHRSSSQEFKLATSGNKFDKQQERNQGGKQITNDIQFNSSSSPITVPVTQQKLNPTIKRLPRNKHSNHSSQLCRSHDHLIPHLQLSLVTSIPWWPAENSNNLCHHHNSKPKVLTGLMLAKSPILETTIHGFHQHSNRSPRTRRCMMDRNNHEARFHYAPNPNRIKQLPMRFQQMAQEQLANQQQQQQQH